MIELYDWQQNAVDITFAMMRKDKRVAPVIVAPTGSGKSVMIAGISKHVIKSGGRVLNICPTKELVQQNAEAMRGSGLADVGVHCAGLNDRSTDNISIVGSAASVYSTLRKSPSAFGRFHFIIFDECDLVNNDDKGIMRGIVSILSNGYTSPPRVVGATATPFRLSQGSIVGGAESLFNTYSFIITIPFLIGIGRLCPPTTEATGISYDTGSLTSWGGDYTSESLASITHQEEVTQRAIKDMIAKSRERKSGIVFCSSIEHCEQVAEQLRAAGESVSCVHGKVSSRERDKRIKDFKAGRTKHLVNCNIATVGFNHPPVDFIVMLRPTCSTRLYIQMIGRGLRVFEGKLNCLVLDYSRNIEKHGPVDAVEIAESAKKKGKFDASGPLTKICPSCSFPHVPMHEKNCIVCDHEFISEGPIKSGSSSSAIILSSGHSINHTKVSHWRAKTYQKRTGFNSYDPNSTPCVMITYYAATGNSDFGTLSEVEVAREWIHPLNKGKLGRQCLDWRKIHIKEKGRYETVSDYTYAINTSLCPDMIATIKVGKYLEVCGWIIDGEFVAKPGSFMSRQAKQQTLI